MTWKEFEGEYLRGVGGKEGKKGKQCNFVLIKMYKNKSYKNGAKGDGLAVTNTWSSCRGLV